MLTILIISLVLNAALGGVVWYFRKWSQLWHRSYKSACDQSRENARIANANFDALKIQKRVARIGDMLFWVMAALAFVLWLAWYRSERRSNPAA